MLVKQRILKLLGTELDNAAVCMAFGLQTQTVLAAVKDGRRIIWEGDPSGSTETVVRSFCRSKPEFKPVPITIYPSFHCDLSLAMGLLEQVVREGQGGMIKTFFNAAGAVVSLGCVGPVVTKYREVKGDRVEAQCTSICRAVLMWKLHGPGASVIQAVAA